ncbi:hypothetical protein [Streptomyces marincola]|uniref:hypothetical protein n=1 Tax=Streptomyces marincola TaxID=2878388 RepID=UPI001CF533C1|nr:hypothetical protein [Streptomyces marincola]UCM91529.1 hypothetical protein LC193_28235 [Streptomyces marincola]
MRAELVWWELDGTGRTIDSLNEHLRTGAVEPWAQVPGLRLKLWIADRAGNRWGAVMIWENERPAHLPPNLAAGLIGRPPTHRLAFDVEAAVEGHWSPAGPGEPGPAPPR